MYISLNVRVVAESCYGHAIYRVVDRLALAGGHTEENAYSARDSPRGMSPLDALSVEDCLKPPTGADEQD